MKGLEEPPGDGGQMNWILFFFLSLKIWIKNNFFFLAMSHSILVPQPGLNPALGSESMES